jgi:hypothetical protein
MSWPMAGLVTLAEAWVADASRRPALNAWKGFQFSFRFCLSLFTSTPRFSSKKMRTRQDGGPRLASLASLVSNACCGRSGWKRFHADERKYIPELGAPQIESCTKFDLDHVAAARHQSKHGEYCGRVLRCHKSAKDAAEHP